MVVPSRSSQTTRVLATLVAVVLFLAPLLYSFHLITEPHVFCPLHGHLESTLDHGTGESVPHDRRDEHKNEDTACLVAASSANAEESVSCFGLLACQADSGILVEKVSSAIVVGDLTAVAPKHSPPPEAIVI